MSAGPPGGVRPPARPASTVALLRRAPGGTEVLMTHRPASMAFGPGLHVFPGGAVDAGDADPGGPLASRSALDAEACARAWSGDLAPPAALGHAVAGVRELFEEAGVLLATHRDGSHVAPGVVAAAAADREPLEELAERLDLVLATDRLVPLSCWVTPPAPGVTRRYDTRFFVADAPDGAEVAADAREVAGHAWLRPAAALARHAAGEVDLWQPTSATLRQLVGVGDAADARRWLSPVVPAAAPVTLRVAEAAVRVRLGAGGGIPGVGVDAWVVGRRRVVVVDPGDPGEPALDAFLAATSGAGVSLAAVVVTSAAPDHVGAAVGLALVAGVPLLASRDAAAVVGAPCDAVDEGDVIELGDVPLAVRLVPGSRAGALVLEAAGERLVLTGDLGTAGASRAIPADVDEDAPGVEARFLATLRGRRLPAHG